MRIGLRLRAVADCPFPYPVIVYPRTLLTFQHCWFSFRPTPISSQSPYLPTGFLTQSALSFTVGIDLPSMSRSSSFRPVSSRLAQPPRPHTRTSPPSSPRTASSSFHARHTSTTRSSPGAHPPPPSPANPHHSSFPPRHSHLRPCTSSSASHTPAPSSSQTGPTTSTPHLTSSARRLTLPSTPCTTKSRPLFTGLWANNRLMEKTHKTHHVILVE